MNIVMRIGLLTDTHIAWEEKELPRRVMEIFEGVDLILHGGDIYTHSVLDELERLAPVLSALGDDDYVSDDPRIKEKHILQLEGMRLWVIHEGPYLPLPEPWLTKWWQRRSSPDEDGYGKPDIIISGHEHRAYVERNDGILCINSGSPNLLHYQRGPGTVGILELNAGKADIEIVHL
jgi:putative phosphoesterase